MLLPQRDKISVLRRPTAGPDLGSDPPASSTSPAAFHIPAPDPGRTLANTLGEWNKRFPAFVEQSVIGPHGNSQQYLQYSLQE